MIAHAMMWLEGTPLATWTRESPSIWAYPTILTLHTVGLGIVVGASAVIDLRLLGFAPRIRVAALGPLFSIVWWAFALNAATGVLLFMSDATTKSKQTVFYVKLMLIALALWDTWVLGAGINPARARGSHDLAAVSTWDSASGFDPRLRRLAAASLFLWAGAITAGRLMAYL